MPDAVPHVLLTGATGFLGKVVLEQLIRRADELGDARIYLLIRPKRDRAPDERFMSDVVASDCFRLLPDGWQSRCVIVAGNVTAPDLGLSPDDRQMLAERVTHIINCAASVDFDRPLEEAAKSNIDAPLNVLAFAKQCASLESMVHVSTAYVWPEKLTAQPCDETLVPLPFDAADAYAEISAGRASRDDLLARTGYANTYTLTKCLAEHLLFARRDDVPLRIVRPSIISACRVHPFPGWLDSTSGFTGFVALYGHGLLRTLACDPDARMDVVPCDEVADRVLRSTFESERVRPIEQAVAGLSRSLTTRDLIVVYEQFFSRYPTGAKPGFKYVGPWGRYFAFREWTHTTLGLSLAHAFFAATRQTKKARRVRRVAGLVRYANRGFRYFSHATFDFRGAEPGTVPEYDTREYHATIGEGVSRHLLKHGPSELPLAGRKHLARGSDARWALSQPKGNVTHRFGGFLLRKMWRRCTELVTFDAVGFEQARAAAEPGDLIVIVPTHRSYFDFLVLPYLFFARPNLRIDIPHIAATEDFSRIPVVSFLLRQGQAFFIKRGVGKADPDLTRRVAALASRGHTLKFFIEGTRSRSRRVLAPRRGLLRALQSTGKRCLIVPVAVSYDRIPEEAALARELAGIKKDPHRLRSILRWIRKLHRGHVRLGRIHVSCGTPLRLEATTDVPALSRAIAAELQAATVISTFHLRTFLSRCPVRGLDLVRLKRAVERRGGTVIESALPVPSHVDDALHECLLNQWRPFFFDDLRRHADANPALADHVEQHGWPRESGRPMLDCPEAQIPGLLEAMFNGVCRDYAEVARYVAQTAPDTPIVARTVANALPSVFRPDVEFALQDMARRGILSQRDDGFRWDGNREHVRAYARSCDWPMAATPVIGLPAIVPSRTTVV